MFTMKLICCKTRKSFLQKKKFLFKGKRGLLFFCCRKKKSKMSFDDDDLARYVYGSGGGGGKSKAPRLSSKEEDYEEQEYPVAKAEYPAAAAAQQKPKGKVSFLVEEDDDEEDERPKKVVRRKRSSFSSGSADAEEENEGPPDDFIESLAKQGKQFTLAIGRNPMQRTNGRKITARAKLAARFLVEQAQAAKLTSNTRQELQMLLDCPDDGTRIDPLITIFTRVPTGTCIIHVKEIVPVSTLLKAIALNAQFTIQVTGKAKSQAMPFAQVSVKPCKENKEIIDVQTFDIEKIVEEKMQEEGHDEQQVKAYMYSVGPVSSEQASDVDFIETHVEQVKDIFKGKLVVLRESKPAARRAAGLIQEEDE